MDFTSMSYSELNNLYIQIGFELLRRSWWLILILFAGALIITKLLNR